MPPTNIVDYAIIAVIGISVLFGLYRGFIASVVNLGGGLVSFLASFSLLINDIQKVNLYFMKMYFLRSFIKKSYTQR